MKKRVLKALSLLLVIFFSTQFLQAKTKFVTVDLDLEEIPDVTDYEIEIKSQSRKVITFKQKKPDFSVKLEVGHYTLRSRAWNKDEFSEWSDWSEILAPPEDVKPDDPKTFVNYINKKNPQASVDLKWNQAAGADNYIVYIKNTENENPPSTVITKNNFYKMELKQGSYQIGIQSISKEGIKSEIKYYSEPVVISRQTLPKIEIQNSKNLNYQWKKLAEAEVLLEIYRKPFFGTQFEKVESIKIADSKFSLEEDRFVAGEYKIAAQYISDTFENGPIEMINTIKKPTENDFQRTKVKF